MTKRQGPSSASAPRLLRRSTPAASPAASQANLEAAPTITLLERGFPFRELSIIAEADQRAVDPAYAAHRWWARRPPGVIRGVLLASVLPASTKLSRFWAHFKSAEHLLAGHRVFDPFVGGGTTLVEAARLGATPFGVDVDPLAITITAHELDPPDRDSLLEHGNALLRFLEQRAGHLYRSTQKGWTPIHYFSLQEVQCPSCQLPSPLYRDLVIARDVGNNGGVLRDCAIVAFCPDCLRVHELNSLKRKELRCCGRRYSLHAGNFAAQRFTCPHCRRKAGHSELKTGVARRRLIAIEETSADKRRRIRTPAKQDFELIHSAIEHVTDHADELDYPRCRLNNERLDPRPLSFGITHAHELFTDRQLAVFGHAFHWLRTTKLDGRVRRSLMLAVSNALTTNNRLCGYATDYGRLAPLFSVRSYAIPALAVELNPFHSSAGRGTLRRALKKLSRSVNSSVRRYVWVDRRAKPTITKYSFKRHRGELLCQSSSDLPARFRDFDLCIFDPPYYDYIAYSELSEFYRAWLRKPSLGGIPLLPSTRRPILSFGQSLGKCLRKAVQRSRPLRPMAFTYHCSSKAGWDAVGIALDQAKLLVSAMWPIKNDAHMGHHSTEGNCEWDIVVVCRRRIECKPAAHSFTVDGWCKSVAPLRVNESDRRNMGYAIQMAVDRSGVPFISPVVRRQSHSTP